MHNAAWVAALVSLMVACKDKGSGAGGGTAVKPVAQDAAAVVAADAAPLADAEVPTVDLGTLALTPAVVRGVQILDLQYGGYATPGLPAIREDGSELVAVTHADDGGRGYLDLRLVVLDGATGKERLATRLVDPDETSDAERQSDESESLAPDEALQAKVRERVAKANARFTEGRWRTLVTTEREDAEPTAPVQEVVVGERTFRYDGEARRLNVLRDGQVAAMHDLRAVVKRPVAKVDAHCPGDLAYLRAVHVDEPSKKVLVELGAHPQGHNCGTEGSTFTLIPLP